MCGKNRWRSPTAEQIFAGREGLAVLSAGLAPDSDTVLDSELVQWADSIFVMERKHRKVIQLRFRTEIGSAKVICLEIADRYRFMDEQLIELLQRRMAPHLPK